MMNWFGKKKNEKKSYELGFGSIARGSSEDSMRDYMEEMKTLNPKSYFKMFYDPTEKYPWAVYEWRRES